MSRGVYRLRAEYATQRKLRVSLYPVAGAPTAAGYVSINGWWLGWTLSTEPAVVGGFKAAWITQRTQIIGSGMR